MHEEQIQYLALDRIICAPQVRSTFDDDALLGLAQTLKEVGQQQPIRVRRVGDKFEVVDGERRLRATKRTGATVIAAVIEEKDLCESEIIYRQLVANCQRAELTPMEKAKAIAHLMRDTQWSAAQTAAKLGMSNATVSRLLALLSLPLSIRKGVEEGTIPASTAYQLGHVCDGQQQEELASQVSSGTLTRDGLSETVKSKRRAARKRSNTACPVRITAVLGHHRSVTVTGHEVNFESFINWLAELLAKAREAAATNPDLLAFIKALKANAKA